MLRPASTPHVLARSNVSAPLFFACQYVHLRTVAPQLGNGPSPLGGLNEIFLLTFHPHNTMFITLESALFLCYTETVQVIRILYSSIYRYNTSISV